MKRKTTYTIDVRFGLENSDPQGFQYNFDKKPSSRDLKMLIRLAKEEDIRGASFCLE